MPEKRSWWRVLAILPLIAATLGIASVVRDWREPETLITIAPLPTETGSVTVYVGGAVARPGLYTLPSGERIEAAIIAAGGLAAEADPDGLNRALRLRDEAQIVVPRKGEPTATPARAAPAASQSTVGTAGRATPATAIAGPINVNTAGVAELAQLPGVGPKLAQAIIDYRAEHGPFAGPDDLARVQGISERMVISWAAVLTFAP